MAGLDTYATNLRGIVDELTDLLGEHRLHDAADALAERIGLRGVLTMSEDEREKALAFMAKTPSQREKALRKLDEEAAALLIMRAKYYGLRGVKAVEIASRLEYLPGSGYRDALDRAARAADSMRQPSIEALTEKGYNYRHGMTW